ncbi:wall-associated receptor kinase-like 8 [Hordeum vulgare subsp. vulgare]|uniref:Protein kinase domain-containing protein n=1 Tax=Hordeum vulgare subsp. vulgare TaxID=112509 RepID=A0A8I6XHN2_HORVV|nr:wall-associated receptor kinase-like 8 [Hordeum vulgare subsp. vulgare]XP_044968215.1 wall-associated receptor kinase-like 8 [Hordeum vulgare subsp. vulgare]
MLKLQEKMILLLPSIPSPQAKLLLPILLVQMALQLLVAKVATAGPVALPGCLEACGNVTVPYPFGFRQGCFHKGFKLTCDETRHPPKLLLSDGVEVDAISLSGGKVRVQSMIVRPYRNMTRPQSLGFGVAWPDAAWPDLNTGVRLAVSIKHNVLVAIGCNLVVNLVGQETVFNGNANGDIYNQYVSACAALCNYDGTDSSETCSGFGCCQTTISQSFAAYGVQFKQLDNSPSGVAFIVDRDWFNRINVRAIQNSTTFHDFSVPTVLEWWLDVEGDRDLLVRDLRSGSGWRCISLNSLALNVSDHYGAVSCNCSYGYEGNPHIVNGCQDIDECLQPDVYPCDGTCTNMPGTHRCTPKKSASRLPGLIAVIAISAGSGIVLSLLGISKITNKFKQRRAKNLRRNFFKKNHGLLLQQLISSNQDMAERMRIFSLEELDQATNKFDHTRILGGGGHGTVYKGILSDQRIVAIKKAKIVVQREIDHFINEVVILSQTNHRNVVKLFGCCLETEVPLLVYEFISNGTLSFHLHGQSENPLSWKDRLRIALETARAIAYLHSAASISVYHRDIKCANILLTDTLTSKVSDFGASRSIAIDETGIVTAVQGTHGYLDPEYYYTSRLTEKSDVYSFGVILAELLTRVTPVFASHSSEVTSLASHFVSLIRDNRLLDILDTQIVEEGGAEGAEVVARLAKACLSLKGEERPTMRQVETTLEDVQNSTVNLSSQITRVNRNAVNDRSYKGCKGSEVTRVYSLEKEFIQSSEIPR